MNQCGRTNGVRGRGLVIVVEGGNVECGGASMEMIMVKKQ